jgi:cobalt/nickel transport system permease protein
MYRYIFVIVDEFMKMRQSKEARSYGGSRWFHIKTYSNMLGLLFVKSYERGESVYLAMCSRGFNGEVKTMDQLRVSKIDIIFFAIIFIILISIRIFAG